MKSLIVLTVLIATLAGIALSGISDVELQLPITNRQVEFDTSASSAIIISMYAVADK